MDSITRTARSAVVSYYNALRRMGSIHRQDKYKLLVLWLFHYLKNSSDYLYKWNGERFEIDRELESDLERRFRCNIPCLTGASCFIKLLPDDNCVPLLEILWDSEDDVNYRLLVTNATSAYGQYVEPINDDIADILNSYMWSNASALLVPNAKEDDTINNLLATNQQ